MKKMLALAVLALTAFAPTVLKATPTRVLTIDNANLIVPDDYDGTFYYSLSPHFANHWYVDAYPSGKSIGWAFLDVGVGNLVVWWNKDFEGGPLYDAVIANSGGLGMTNTAFTADNIAAWEPKELRVKAPDNKLALGYALPILDSLTLGLCFRLAQLNNTKDQNSFDGNGNATYVAGTTGTAATYQNSYYAGSGLGILKYANAQVSNGMVISPQFSFTGSSILLDAKLDMVWNGIANKHTEDLRDASMLNTGSITQTLKDKGAMSWALKPRLRIMLDNASSLVLRGNYGIYDLSNEHRVTGSFNGPGFTPLQRSGYDHVDQNQDLTLTPWEFMAGWMKTWDKGKDLVVLGVGANGSNAKVVDRSFQQSATAVTYNDLVKKSVVDVTVNNLAVPVLMGTELSLSSWCKARGMITRNFFTATSNATVSSTYNTSGTLTATGTTNTGSDYGPGWIFASGFGLYFGQFTWDTAINTSFLATPAGTAMVDPLYQSSFTYEF